MKIPRIAVMLRGHIRTWQYLYPVIFHFYDSIAEQVDYYFSTWDIYSEDIINLTRDTFTKNNKNLIILCRSLERDCTSWTGPAWLSKNLLPYKIEQERIHGVYDAIFDTRPDIIYSWIENKTIISPEPETLYTTRFTNHKKIFDMASYYDTAIGLEDHFFMMSSKFYEFFCNRYLRDTPYGSHTELKIMCDEQNINVCSIDWVNVAIIRPNSEDCIPDAFDYFNNLKTNMFSSNGIMGQWMTMSLDARMECLNRRNILPKDFITNSKLSSIAAPVVNPPIKIESGSRRRRLIQGPSRVIR